MFFCLEYVSLVFCLYNAYLAAASNEVGINVGVGSPNPPLT